METGANPADAAPTSAKAAVHNAILFIGSSPEKPMAPLPRAYASMEVPPVQGEGGVSFADLADVFRQIGRGTFSRCVGGSRVVSSGERLPWREFLQCARGRSP